jgi:hypothetical protein
MTLLRTPMAGFFSAPPARLCKTTLLEFQRTHPEEAFDLIVLFQPGFEEHLSLLTDGSLAACLRSGAKVIGTGYAQDETVMESAIVAAHGFSFVRSAEANPFGVDLAPEVEKPFETVWGSWLWSLTDQTPGDDFEVDEERMNELLNVANMFVHLATTVRGFKPSEVGTIKTFSGREVIFVFVHLMVCVETHELFIFGPNGELTATDLMIDQATFDAFPGESAPLVERWVWSMYLFAGVAEMAQELEMKERSRVSIH